MNRFLKSMRLYETAPAGGGGTALTGTPPAGTPPAGTPPAGTPPAGTPPAGTPATHWAATLEGLPDAMRASPALVPFKTPADAVKAYVDVQPLIGADKVIMPKDWNDKTQVAAFNKSMGVPEKAEGYKLGEVLTGKLPQGFKLNEPLVGQFQSIALEAGLSPRQAATAAEKFMLYQVEEQRTATQTATVERANALNAFKKERGTAYDTDIAMAQKFLVNYGSEELKQILIKTGMGDSPIVIAAFAKAGASLREDTMQPSGLPGALQGNDAQSAQVRLAEMKADPNFMAALNSQGHPNHNNAVAEWTKVNGMIPARGAGGAAPGK